MEKLKGSVKCFTETTFKVDENFTDSQKLIENSKSIANYDEKGSLLEWKNILNGHRRNCLVYDNTGLLKEINNYDDEGILSSTDFYKHDTKGKVIEIQTDGGFLKSKEVFIYDDQGHLIEKREHISDDAIDSLFYKYNEDGDKIECVGELDPSMEGTTYVKFTYKYDLGRKLIEKNRELTNRDGSSYMTTWKYDKFENEIEEITYDVNGSLETKISFQYEYDATGNWIKKIKLEKDKDNAITKREIEYYS